MKEVNLQFFLLKEKAKPTISLVSFEVL